MNVARVFYGLGLAGTITVLCWCAQLTPWCIRCGSPRRRSRPSCDLEHAARSIGASPWRAFWTVTLSLAAGIMASAIFVFQISR
jgi:ABC-type spermidine/putrescine transport system permease subunit II